MRRSGDDLLDRLNLLEKKRAPYANLLSEIVADTLGTFLPADERTIVEIGAGTGQLYGWLPPALRTRTVATEPVGAAARALQERFPAAKVVEAEAERLPFEDQSLGGVVALCVFDAFDDPAVALRELARVLAPGGRFFHFLDMSTLRARPFAELAAQGLVPVPNVLDDPCRHEWPLDILLLRREWLKGLLELTARLGHPLSATFAPAFAPWLAASFDAEAATEAFRAIARYAETRSAFGTLLASASELAGTAGYPPLDPIPFFSGLYLKDILEGSFGRAPFQIERSAIVTKGAWRAPENPNESTLGYRSLCLGHERLLDTLPARLLAPPPPARAPADGMLVEAGLFVFVARRL